MNLFSKTAAPIKQLFTLLTVIAVLGVVQPFLWRFVAASSVALRARQASEQQLEDMKERIEVMETTYATQKPLLDQLSAVFPYEHEASQVVERLEQLADRQNIELSTKNILVEAADTKKADRKLSRIVITVQVVGSPVQLLQYMEAVENTQEAVQIRSWAMNPEPVSNAPGAILGRYTLNMNAVFYLQKENNADTK